MYKNQLQELAQRSCFNLPTYTCMREGPDHAPRFKVTVNFNGEMFESPHFCSTIRQAEQSAAKAALNSLFTTGPSRSLAARILDETGVYKNLLQDISQRLGASLPRYTTYRSGPSHQPVFTGTVELAGITFTGEAAKNKKRAEKNAALAGWLSLKQLAASFSSGAEYSNEPEQFAIARLLLGYCVNGKLVLNNAAGPVQFNTNFCVPNQRPSSPQPPPATTSRILPLIHQRTSRNRPHRSSPHPSAVGNGGTYAQPSTIERRGAQLQRFPAAGAAPYIPFRSYRRPCHGNAPPVMVRTPGPVFSTPPFLPSNGLPTPVIQGSAVPIAPPVCVSQAVPSCAGRLVRERYANEH